MENFETVLATLKNYHKVNVKREPSRLSFGNEEECRALFEKAFLYSDRSVSKFVFLPEYAKVVEWMVDNKGKGLLLMGHVGRGKTVISTGVIPSLFFYRFRKVVHPEAAEDMPIKLNEILKYPLLSIDDLGTEPIANDFGVKFESFSRLINDAEAKLKLTFISTNLTSEELYDRYGERSVDRINRLCKVIKFEGDSLRK